MADIGAVRGYLGGLPDSLKKTLGDVFTYVLPNLRVGLPGHQKPAENMAWIQLDGLTPSTALTEFSIAHGLQTAPRVIFPCLDVTSSGTQMIPLICSRAADSRRLYFRSTSTSASFTVFAETR